MLERATVSARSLIADSGLPRRDAESLLLGLLDKDRSWLYARGDDPLGEEIAAVIQKGIERRLAGEPIAYILGVREFWSMPLRVDPTVLIPRPDTELLVEWALELADRFQVNRCLDLGTGSGAIALALKRELPNLEMTAVDASASALATARENGKQLCLEVEWLHGSWFDPVHARRWPLVVSNPPYIAEHDPHLSQGDLPREPLSALASGPDGLSDIRTIVAAAPAHLEAGGWLCLEHGWDQGEAVRQLFEQAGFCGVETRRDLAGHERVTGGQC